MKKFWTDAEIAILRARYPHELAANIAADLGRTLPQTYNKASRLKLHKTEAFRASRESSVFRQGQNIGAEFRFQPGREAWNKGIAFNPGGRSSETQFKEGSAPKNRRPVGSTRIDVDGYVVIKIADGLNHWKLLHHQVWKQAHGEYPSPDMALIFKDGNKQNCDISNLELITRRENMLRNSVHRLPKELAEVIQLVGALNRKVNDATRRQ